MDLILKTERLTLRPLQLPDAEAMFVLDSNPNVHLYLGNNPVKTVSECDDIIKNIQNQYVQNGIGRFAVVITETNESIGWAGLKFITKPENNHADFYDIGYRLQEQHWRKGYALEAAFAWRDHAFQVMNIPVIYASAHIENTGSNAILQKIGMEYISEFLYEDLPCNWYQLQNPNAKTHL